MLRQLADHPVPRSCDGPELSLREPRAPAASARVDGHGAKAGRGERKATIGTEQCGHGGRSVYRSPDAAALSVLLTTPLDLNAELFESVVEMLKVILHVEAALDLFGGEKLIDLAVLADGFAVVAAGPALH